MNNWPTDKQLAKAWEILDKLVPGQILIVKDFAKTNPDVFIQSTKMYIDCYNSLEFNKDYTKVKRLNR